MPKCYVLIGPPGSGKSTWVKNQTLVKDFAYISTDQYVDAYAESQGKTYSEVFKDYMPTAVELMCRDVNDAEAVSQDIIWDQTSMSRASRAKKFRMLPDYEMIAVVMPTISIDELLKRVNSRPGKHIPDSVVYSMIESYEEPTAEEGFSEVIHL